MKMFLSWSKKRLNLHSSFSSSSCLERQCLDERYFTFHFGWRSLLKTKRKSQENHRSAGLKCCWTKPVVLASPWTSVSMRETKHCLFKSSFIKLCHLNVGAFLTETLGSYVAWAADNYLRITGNYVSCLSFVLHHPANLESVTFRVPCLTTLLSLP